MSELCRATKDDGTPCGSVACYSDSRGQFCGSHWGRLPEQTMEVFPRELEMLRDFYDSWVAYHTIPKDRTDSQSTVADYLIHVHTCIQQERGKIVHRCKRSG